MVLHLSSVLSKVGPFPMMKRELFARVKATFIRLGSRKKPIDCKFGPERTQERMMISFS